MRGASVIEFKAYLGEHGGLHFACTGTSGDVVVEELLRLDKLAREITGTGLGDPVSAMIGEEEVNPMVILALVATGHVSSRVDANKVDLYVRDPRDPVNPAAEIFAGTRLSGVTVAVCFSGPDKER